MCKYKTHFFLIPLPFYAFQYKHILYEYEYEY